jgi:phosphonate transport system substrate-binding protein
MPIKIMMKGTALLGLALATVGLASCDKKAEDTTGVRKDITFSVLSFEKSQKLDQMWHPIVVDMEKQTGLKVKSFYSSNYTSLIEAMRFNQTQAGFFSSASGLEAVNRGNAEVFAHVTNPDGSDGYKSIIIVRADSKITQEDLLKCDHKINFGMGDVKSASGTIAPKAFFFLPHNVDVDNCFRNVRSGSHEANVEGVIAGVVDAATANSDTLKELSDTPEGQVKLAKLKVIWESDSMPKGVIVYRKDLDPVTKEKLRSFFLSYGHGDSADAERQRTNLATFQWGPFQPADASYLIPERVMEARVALAEAKKKGDAAAIAEAQATYDKAMQDKAAAAAKTAPQASADLPAAAQASQ